MLAHRRVAWFGLSVLGTAALLAGCAGEPRPTAKMATADVNFRKAEEDQAAQYAPLEMRLAREKLEAARKAIDDDQYAKARRLSEEASADAELAAAKARAERARHDTDEMRRTVGTIGAAAGARGSGTVTTEPEVGQ
jgi:uncharacterized protein DUF4398